MTNCLVDTKYLFSIRLPIDLNCVFACNFSHFSIKAFGPLQCAVYMHRESHEGFLINTHNIE